MIPFGDSEEEDSELEAINKKLISPQSFQNFRPYVPEEFADFSIYNASLENREWFSSKSDFMSSRVLEKEVSRSPTTSSITSGYFSHSASNATLSDMLVPCSDSTDQLASHTKELDSSDPSGSSLAHDLRSSLNKECRESEKELVREKLPVLPLKENSALTEQVPLSFSATDRDSQQLPRAGSLSALSSLDGKNTVEFSACEVTVEHTMDVLEDHSFTEFMGVEDGKDFDHSTAPQSCSLLSSNGVSASESPRGPGKGQSTCTGQQSSAAAAGDRLEDAVESPFGSGLVKDTSDPETYPDASVDDFITKDHLDGSDCEEGASADQGHVLPSWVAVGEQVCVGSNKMGTVRYVGTVDFSAGIWVGVELNVQLGKHDGIVKGREYFHCKPRHGVFVRPGRLSKAPAPARKSSSTSRSQASSTSEKRKSSVLQSSSVTPKTGGDVLCHSGDAAASAFSRKQENRKSWIN